MHWRVAENRRLHRVGETRPVLADLSPSGKYFMSDLVDIGGITPLMKTLLEAGLLHGELLTVTGKTMAENLANVKTSVSGGPDDHSSVQRSRSKRQPPRDSLGNLATQGAVAKISGKEGLEFTGTAGSLTVKKPPCSHSGWHDRRAMSS